MIRRGFLYLSAIALLAVIGGCGHMTGTSPTGVTGGEGGYGIHSQSFGYDDSGPLGTWRQNYDSGEYEYAIFSSDGNIRFEEYEDDIMCDFSDGTFSVSGNVITIVVDGDEWVVPYEISGDRLTLVFESDPWIFHKIY